MSKLIKKNYLYCWCCDNKKNTGEGKLSKLFINELNKVQKVKVYTVKNLNFNSFFSKVLNYKYFSPLVGILFCWLIFIKKERPAYVNYLPLWNSLLFIFLPPNTIFGPITGGSNFDNTKTNIIRKYIFPITYKISEFFLNIRKTNINFSTELLKPYLWESTKKKSKFNYVFKLISKKKKKQKKIDFLIYNRKYKNKENFFKLSEIKYLIKYKFNVHIVGDKINFKSVINHGYISNQKIQRLLEITRFSVTSDENIYSLFTIECINNNVKLITNKIYKNKIKYFKDNFIFLDQRNIKSINKLIGY